MGQYCCEEHIVIWARLVEVMARTSRNSAVEQCEFSPVILRSIIFLSFYLLCEVVCNGEVGANIILVVVM